MKQLIFLIALMVTGCIYFEVPETEGYILISQYESQKVSFNDFNSEFAGIQSLIAKKMNLKMDETALKKIYLRFSNTDKFVKDGVGDVEFKNGNYYISINSELNKENILKVFSHELLHICMNIEYGNALDLWFEEGLARYCEYRGERAKNKVPKDVALICDRDAVLSSEDYDAYYSIIKILEERNELKELLRQKKNEPGSNIIESLYFTIFKQALRGIF